MAGAGPRAAAALRHFNADGRLPGLRVSDVRPCRTPLAPGRHAGNRFRVLVRNVTATAAEVAAAGRRLRRRGFVNYFGLQRFGTGSIPAVEVRRRAPPRCIGRATNARTRARCRAPPRAAARRRASSAAPPTRARARRRRAPPHGGGWARLHALFVCLRL